MKTKEIPFSTIQKIKSNNNLMEQLSIIENVVNDLYYNRDNTKMTVDSVKKDIKDYGEDFEEDYNAESFLYTLMKFIETNQQMLINESKSLIKSK